jgi:hypothetical protein
MIEREEVGRNHLDRADSDPDGSAREEREHAPALSRCCPARCRHHVRRRYLRHVRPVHREPQSRQIQHLHATGCMGTGWT